MRLILVRHAHADPGDPDELRALSARGREEARALAEELAADAPELVLTSPLLRARDTAAAIAKAADAELRVDDRLVAGAPGILAALEGLTGTVVVVGHQPDCSQVALELGGIDVDFQPAGHVVLEL